jgi:F-type H+-transporting ATPase subunit epsilon
MTPDQVFWDDVAEEIILPTNTGQMGVLSRHTSLISALDIGVMSIRQGGSWFALALMNGFALIQNDRVTVLVNGAAGKSDIDLEEARRAFDDAEAEINRAGDPKASVEAALAFKRARTRLVVANRNALQI